MQRAEREGVIYTLSLDGSTHRYVGMTVQPMSRRWSQHYLNGIDLKSKTPVNCWLNKHLASGDLVVMGVLDRAPATDLGKLEIYWIETLDSLGYDLLNCSTREQVPLAKLSREKITAQLIGRKLSEQHRAKLGDALRGVPQTEAVRKARSLQCLEDPDSRRAGTHRRWHFYRNVFDKNCTYCLRGVNTYVDLLKVGW